VYVGQDARTGQIVDITLLPPDTAASAGGADRFLTEMRAVLAFRHPGFVRPLDCNRLSDGAVYLVSEHVEAEWLSERLKRDGGLASDLAAVREVVGQTAAALAAAHKAGLLYLCLRPEHMLLVPASLPGLPVTVRLLELGLGSHFLSRIRQMAPGKELPASMLWYSSPEQCRGSGVDHRSDTYALGCVLFELLVGRPPFWETELWGLVSAHAHAMPPRIRALRPELPSAVDDLVARMLEKDPAQRPSSMEEIIAVMQAPIPEPGSIAEFADAPPSAPFARTVILDPGPPVPKPADDISSTPGFRPTRLLTPAEDTLVPRRPDAGPAAVARPLRVRRDPLPGSAGTAPAGRGPTPASGTAPARRQATPSSRGRGGTVNVRRSYRGPMLVGVALACIALVVGLLLWLVRPKGPEARRAPIEETPAREQPIPPPVAPFPASEATEVPTPAAQRPAAEPAQPKLEPTDEHPSNLGKNHLPSRRSRSHDPASSRPFEPHEGVLQPTFMKH
jgi:hypothetical protein